MNIPPAAGDSPKKLSETPVHDAATGETRGVVVGLEEFSSAWERDVELPHQLSFNGWQMSDDDHPADGGEPAYRLVHKTIRTIPVPNVELNLHTLLLRLENGPVTVGAPIFHHSLQARREGTFLVPEWGSVSVDEDGTASYHHSNSNSINIEGHQETLPITNYVEILCKLRPDAGPSYAEQIAAGRASDLRKWGWVDC